MIHVRRSGPPRAVVTGVLALVLAFLLAEPSRAFIRHSITVDGNVADWGDVLTDPENVVADAGSFSDPPDPDFPGTADRDLRGVAVTYDATNLYVFFRRTLSGNSAFDFLLYIDLGHDKRLNTTDLVWHLSYSGDAYQNGGLHRYQPVNVPLGDAITGDGVREPGSLGVVVPGTPGGADSPDGIEFEARIPWSALGVPAGSCLWLHPSISLGLNLPGQVEDNTDPLDTQDVALRLERDHDGSAPSPGTIDYAHRACNDGNCSDTFDLTVRSQRGWRVDVYSDPNGDGNPADGALLGRDGIGDGDYSDTRDGDFINPGGDTNGNLLVDTGPVAPNACFNYVVRVHVPSGVATGTTDLERVRARSATRAQDLATNIDITTVGPIAIFKDESRSGVAGDDVWVPHRACNHQGFPDTFNLTSSSTSGWVTQVWSDPNGDGNPADGAPISSVGPLAPGACANLILRVTIPGGTAGGTVDIATATITSATNGSVTDSVSDTITVASTAFALTPNHARDAGPFNTLFLPHVITNHQSVSDSFTLDIPVFPAGWTLTLLTDPDGDGEPDDSAVIPPGSNVGPVRGNGGRYTFLLRVDVPQSAPIGSVNVIQVRARSVAAPTQTSIATDTITIRRVLTYSDPLFARPSKTFFVACGRVYVQAHGLLGNKDYRFIWKDPLTTIQRTSPTYGADDRGRVDDSFAIPCGVQPGNWRIDLQIRSGSSWSDVDFATFTTLDPATDGGEITRLETDQGIYNVDGDLLNVESTLSNDTDADYVETRADYVVFRDTSSDGVPTTGEDYIRADGTRALWSAGAISHRTEPITIYEGLTYEDFWNIANAQFDIEGTWCIWERWYTICTSGSCGDVTIDTELRCFLVSCLPAPTVNAGADKHSCGGAGVPLSDATSDADTFAWTVGGGGGTFTPSNLVLNPTWTPPGPGTYTLTLTGTFTSNGCTSADSLVVVVDPLPVVDAGAAKTTCAGDAIALSDASGGIADTYAWTDGGVGGTFTPSSTVLHPSYAPPDPSPGSVTLTLVATVSSTGCSASDALALAVNPNPVMDAGADKTTCAGDGIALADSSGGAADSFTWTDGGAGGTFTPSSTVLHPTYAPPDPSAPTITLALTARITATGCDSVDSLTLDVLPNPIVTAGADKATCADVAVDLSDADGGAADTFAWSDGVGTGTFTPDETVENPSYSNAAGTYTLTLLGTVSSTGCDAADTLQIVIHPNPVITAGADKVTCDDVAVALSDADGGGADTFSWSDGGAFGTWTPSETVENPSYSNSPGTYTLAFTATHSGTGCSSVDTVQVVVNPEPIVTAGSDKVACADQAVALSDADGGAGDTFSWSDGGGTGTFTPDGTVENPSYTNATPGTYTLTLTSTISGTGCSASDTLQLVVTPNPVVTAGSDKAACADEVVALSDADGGAADTFAWDDGVGTGTFTPSGTVENPSYSNDTPGTYTLTLTATIAGSGCSSSDTLQIVVSPNPVVTAGADKTACTGDAAALSDADGGAGDSFSWSDGVGTGIFTPNGTVENPAYSNTTPGTYTLTFTSTIAATGCSASDTVIVVVEPRPVVTAGADKRACAGDALALADADGGAADTFSWSDGVGTGVFTPSATVENPSYSNATPGTYTLTLTASIGGSCEASDSLQFVVDAPPVVTAGADKATCEGQAVALSDADGGAADTFSWSDGVGTGVFTPDDSSENPTYSNTTPGTYTLTLTATISSTGCSASDSVVVTVGEDPVVFAGADKSVCVGASVALSDSSAGIADMYAWSDGGAGTFTPSSGVLHPTWTTATPGTYTLTLTATDSSTGCFASDSVTVVIAQRPSVDAGAPKDGCAGASIPLADATSDGTTFSWSGGGGGTFTPSSTVLNPTYSNATAGTYTLTLTATSGPGCTSSDTVQVIVRSLPIASFTVPGGQHCEDTPICFDNGSSQAVSYQWDFGDPDGNTSTDFEPCFSYAQAGTYTVTLLATNACGSSATTRDVVVSPKPVADFTFSTQGNRFCKNRNINFTDTSSASPTSWQWDFGDGATSTLQNPVHAYVTDGVFIVSLVACNSCGCSGPTYKAIEIAASCQTNCEANSNQIDCEGPPTSFVGDTCTDHDNFNTTSYQCGPDHVYSGENKTFDLNYLAGSNFVLRIVETVAEPNGYELDLMVSDRCNPPRCVSWGDDEVLWDDRTGVGDVYVIVDGRNGTCGPFRLEVDCLDEAESGACTPPVFAGILDAEDVDPCSISGILITWNAATSWGTGTDGLPCASGMYEIWRAPSSDLTNERRVGTVPSGTTSFLDDEAVPGILYTYRVHAINTCCAEPRITTATAEASDGFAAGPVSADAGPDRTLTCTFPTATLLGSASGGTGSGFDYLWSPATGLSDPTRPNPTVSAGGTYTLTVTDRTNACSDTDTVTVLDHTVPPTVSAGPDRDITCTSPIVTLAGSATGGDGSGGRVFSWTPSGPLDDPSSQTPQTSTPGTYTLTVTDTATGCSASDSVLVVDDDAPPVAGAGSDKTLTCAVTEVILDGSASGGDGRAGYSYSWAPAAGLDDASLQFPRASVPGTWTLTVTDTYTGCTDTDEVTVGVDRAAPVAGAGLDREITCTESTVTLDGSASGGNGTMGYTFRWAPSDQLSNPDIPDPTTGVAGTYTLTVTDVANGCTSTDTVDVTLDPLVPTADAGPDKEITCLTSLVTLEGDASGGDGSGGYSYRWEPAGQVSDPDIARPTTSVPGIYTLTVTTDANGCTARDTVTVIDNDAPPVVSAGPDKVLDCDSSSVVLEGAASGGDGSDGYLYSWTPTGGLSNPSAPQPTATLPGTFTLTVTDVHTGCTASDSVVVTQDLRAPTVSAGPDKALDCTTTSAVLEGAASGGNGSAGYDYHWTPATGLSDQDVAQPTATLAGTFTLTVTDRANGCTGTDTVVVTRDVAAPIASAGADRHLDCTVTSVVLDGAASGGNGSSGYLFAWTPATGLSDPGIAQPTATQPGTFTLTVTDRANGCTGTDTVVVTQDVAPPVADAGADRLVSCLVSPVTLLGGASGGNGSSGYDFRWEPAGDVSNPDVPRPTTDTPGLYTLTVTDRANGCTDQDTVFVNEGRIPPIADAGPDGSVTCAAPIAVLQGSASGGDGTLGYTYRWEPAGSVSNPDIAAPTTTSPGAYTLTVTDRANGCTATDTAVIADDRAAPVTSAGPDKLIDCVSAVVTLEGSATGGNGTSGYDYSWSPGNRVSDPSSPTPTTTQQGTYTLTVTDRANGCTSTDSVVVARDRTAPVASAGPNKVLDCDTASVILEGAASGGNGTSGYDYSWSPATGLSDASAPQPTATQAGTFTLTVTDRANHCTDTDSVTVSVDLRAPVAGAGPDRIIDCDTPSVILAGTASGGNGSAGYAFAWTPATGLSDPAIAQPSATQPGTFTLTVTDRANGCTATDSVTVGEDLRAPTANAGPDRVLDCFAPGVTLNGSASGGNGSLGYSFHWEPAGAVTDPDAAVTQATAGGIFTLTVTDGANGCTGTDQVLVTTSAPAPIANAGPDGVISCLSPVGNLLGSASGGDGTMGYTAQWSPTAGVADPTALVTTTTEPGTYTLLVTDVATGCRGADTVTIVDDRIPPIVSAGPDAQVDCDTPAVTLRGAASGGNGSAGYTYAWTPPAGLSDASSPTPTTSMAGTWTLTVTDRANGCAASDVVTVTVDLRVPVVDAGADKVIDCNSSSVVLDGTASGGSGAGLSYRWAPAAGLSDPDLAQPTASQARIYTLTVTDDGNGCTATDSVTVTIDVRVPTADAGPDAALSCLDPLVPLTGAASGGNGSLGYAYRWEPATGVLDADAASTQAFAGGTYTLTVTDLATGCTATDTASVAPAVGAPTADAGPDLQQTCVSLLVTLVGRASGGDGTSGYSYRWEPAADVADPDSATTTTSVPGTYTLTVLDVATGCLAVDAVVVLPVPAPLFPEPSALDQRPGATPLTVTWLDPTTRTTLAIAWEDIAAFEYRVYQGTIANFRPPRGFASYDHGRAACGLSSPSASIPRPAGDAYFIAVSANCDGTESSYGRSSLGVERPDAATASGNPCP